MDPATSHQTTAARCHIVHSTSLYDATLSTPSSQRVNTRSSCHILVVSRGHLRDAAIEPGKQDELGIKSRSLQTTTPSGDMSSGQAHSDLSKTVSLLSTQATANKPQWVLLTCSDRPSQRRISFSQNDAPSDSAPVPTLIFTPEHLSSALPPPAHSTPFVHRH